MHDHSETTGRSDAVPWQCPGCGGTSFTVRPDGSLTCDDCQAAYVAPERACPACGATYQPEARRCPACGADLVRDCPACGAQNPWSASECLACGQELDILEALFARIAGTRTDWLRQVREGAPVLKAQEETASQARLAEMWEAEARRREDLERARAERDRQQRVLWTVAIVVLVIVLALIALTLVISSPPSPHVYPY